MTKIILIISRTVNQQSHIKDIVNTNNIELIIGSNNKIMIIVHHSANISSFKIDAIIPCNIGQVIHIVGTEMHSEPNIGIGIDHEVCQESQQTIGRDGGEADAEIGLDVTVEGLAETRLLPEGADQRRTLEYAWNMYMGKERRMEAKMTKKKYERIE